MKLPIITSCIPVLGFLFLIGCTSKNEENHSDTQIAKPYVMYAEYANRNDTMRNGLNVRKFDSAEVNRGGSAIKYQSDGSFALDSGTYHISGFSIVSMQTGFDIPQPKYHNTYPGYCLAYFREDSAHAMQKMISVGSPATAYSTTPSFFDFILSCDKMRYLYIGHQAGDTLHNEVYMSVYQVGEDKPSPHHVFARISITQL